MPRNTRALNEKVRRALKESKRYQEDLDALRARSREIIHDNSITMQRVVEVEA